MASGSWLWYLSHNTDQQVPLQFTSPEMKISCRALTVLEKNIVQYQLALLSLCLQTVIFFENFQSLI